MLSRGYFDLFQKFYPNIVKYFDEFVNTKSFIEKITRCLCIYLNIDQDVADQSLKSINVHYVTTLIILKMMRVKWKNKYIGFFSII